MDNRRRNPSHYNNRHRKRRKRKISPLEYPSMLVKWMIKNKAMSAVLGVLLAVVIGTIILVSWGMSKGKTEKRKALHRKQLSRKMLPRRKADKQENHRRLRNRCLKMPTLR